MSTSGSPLPLDSRTILLDQRSEFEGTVPMLELISGHFTRRGRSSPTESDPDPSADSIIRSVLAGVPEWRSREPGLRGIAADLADEFRVQKSSFAHRHLGDGP